MSACKVVGCGKSGRLCPGCVAACMYAEYGQQVTHEARCGTFYEGLCQRMAASACRCETLAATVRMYRDELAKAGSGGQYKGHPVSTAVMSDITALQGQVRRLQAELKAEKTCVDFALAVMDVVKPCFRPETTPKPDAVLDLIRKRCVGHRAGTTTPTPAAKTPAYRDYAIERLQGRLDSQNRRIDCTRKWLALALGGVLVLSVLAYFN